MGIEEIAQGMKKNADNHEAYKQREAEEEKRKEAIEGKNWYVTKSGGQLQGPSIEGPFSSYIEAREYHESRENDQPFSTIGVIDEKEYKRIKEEESERWEDFTRHE